MGQLAYSVVGAAIGFFTPVGPYYGWMLGSCRGACMERRVPRTACNLSLVLDDLLGTGDDDPECSF